VNPHFGTSQDLINFVNAAHERDIWVMVDIVLNHAGPVGFDFQAVSPFNESQFYHKACEVTQYTCMTEEIYHCRLANLPDLNQSVPFVKDQLTKAVNWALDTFDFDGIRMDTVMYIRQSFWVDFYSNIGGKSNIPVYLAGEVFSDFSCNLEYVTRGVPATLNYPLFWTLRSVFQKGASMYNLGSYWRQQGTLPQPNWELNFIDNQDNDRFLQGSASLPNYKSAIAYTYFTNGIPCVYYGTEQLMNGRSSDNSNREPLWPTGYQSTEMSVFLTALNTAYNVFNPTSHDVEERWQDDSFYCLVRGQILFCATNTDSQQQSRTIPNLPFEGAGTVCNFFNSGQCQQGAGTMTITIYAGQSPVLFAKKQ
jgi:alpha-amylase